MNIMFCGGNTLGHVIPLLRLKEYLKKQDESLFFSFIGSKKPKEEELVRESIKNCYTIELDYHHKLKLIKDLYKAYKYSKNILIKDKIELVIASGGFYSFPVLWAARALKIRVFLLEENAVLGFTNRFFLSYAENVFLSLPLYSHKMNPKMHLIGNPSTNFKKTVTPQFCPKKNKTILFLGGSNGSEFINALAYKLRDDLDSSFHFVLVCGKKYKAQTKRNMIVLNYHKRIYELIGESDLVISRAGGSTISEILHVNKPGILIPSPNVKNNHQYKNAKILLDEGCFYLMEEKNFNYESLKKQILHLLNDKISYEAMLKSQRKNDYGEASLRIYEFLCKKDG